MPDLTILGGVYLERCILPSWHEVYGSAGRATEAIRNLLTVPIRLVTYTGNQTRPFVEQIASIAGATLDAIPFGYDISFEYFHPLSTPIITPPLSQLRPLDPIRVNGDVVLRYGMLEGDAIVDARVAVYDPQSAFGALHFKANGSRAQRLAVVLNKYEAFAMTGETDDVAAVKRILEYDGAEVVVLKLGSRGALVATATNMTTIPVYETQRVWKIGSGDVFSASFAALWGCNQLPAEEAADLASRATAYYCDTRSLPVPEPSELRKLYTREVRSGTGIVYLASPFFDIGQRWLVEETRSILLDMGVKVFSPVHEVGPGPAEIVAPEDLKGLDNSQVVLAVLNGLDAGTIFEVGYAVKMGIPVIALAQNIKDEDLKMISGSGCEIVDDFASAIYRTAWRLPVS